jgi:hypothetical protein
VLWLPIDDPVLFCVPVWLVLLGLVLLGLVLLGLVLLGLALVPVLWLPIDDPVLFCVPAAEPVLLLGVLILPDGLAWPLVPADPVLELPCEVPVVL